MTPVQAGFVVGFAVMYVIAMVGVVRSIRKQMQKRDEMVDSALAAVGKKRPERKRRVVDKGYRAWFMYRVLNACGLDGVTRFIWQRRRNAWLIRGFFTRFK